MNTIESDCPFTKVVETENAILRRLEILLSLFIYVLHPFNKFLLILVCVNMINKLELTC